LVLIIALALPTLVTGKRSFAFKLESSNDDCSRTGFTFTIDTDKHKYDLPVAGSGEEISKNCEFGKLTSGQITFKCSGGKWVFSGHQCKDPDGGCRGSEFTMTIGKGKHTYSLPSASKGKEISEDCNFGELTSGKVTFKCSNGKWAYSDHECKEPDDPNGGCRAVDLSMTMGTDKHVYSLPPAGNGKEISEACHFGELLTGGQIIFKCSDLKWKYSSNHCEVPDGGCLAVDFTFTKNAHAGMYQLPHTRNGVKTSKNCEFEGKPADGLVTFQCTNGQQKIVEDTCEVPAKL